MTGRPRSVSDETIFTAVAAVIGESGPSGLTLAAVATRVNLSPPALTQRFGSKRGLLLAFATQTADRATDHFAAVRAAASGPLDAARTALLTLPAPDITPERLANHLAFLQMDLTDPELRTHAVAQSRNVRAALAALLADARQQGQLNTDATAAIADDLYTTYNGAILTWAIDGNGDLPTWLGTHIDRTLAPHLN